MVPSNSILELQFKILGLEGKISLTSLVYKKKKKDLMKFNIT